MARPALSPVAHTAVLSRIYTWQPAHLHKENWAAAITSEPSLERRFATGAFVDRAHPLGGWPVLLDFQAPTVALLNEWKVGCNCCMGTVRSGSLTLGCFRWHSAFDFWCLVVVAQRTFVSVWLDRDHIVVGVDELHHVRLVFVVLFERCNQIASCNSLMLVYWTPLEAIETLEVPNRIGLCNNHLTLVCVKKYFVRTFD